jgi:hypothetical protein
MILLHLIPYREVIMASFEAGKRFTETSLFMLAQYLASIDEDSKLNLRQEKVILAEVFCGFQLQVSTSK